MVKSFASVLTVATVWACAAGLVAPATAGAASRTLTVTTTADPDNGVGSCASGGSCSLREAVNQADAESGDQIVVPAGTYMLNSSFGQLAFTSDATLAGSGASGTIISGGGAIRILAVTSGSVTISGVTLTDGKAPVGGQGGAAMVNAGASLTTVSDVVSGSTAGSDGGGIEDKGALAVQNSTITGNSSNPNSSGGGIDVENYGSGAVVLSIADSTVSGNHAGHGGGISFANNSTGTVTVTIAGTTISGNAANSSGAGGGIYDWNGSTETVTNSTIANNTSDAGVGGVDVHSADTFINDTIAGNTQATSGTGQQVDIQIGGILTMQNTIVAGSGAGDNCHNTLGTFTDHGHNLDDGDTCGFTPAGGDLINADPKLGALQGNGGPTETMALLSGSPAINAGTNTGCPATDQRGVARPQQGTCDIGAYEVAPPPSGAAPSTPAITTPAVPHKFAFRKVKVRANGLLVVPVVVPWAGKLTARATFTVRVRHHKRTFRYGATTAKAHKAGTVTLKVRLRGKAAKELRKIRHAAVTITVTFAPTGGTRHTEHHKVTVRRSAHGKYR